MLKKNVAVTGFTFSMINKWSGEPITTGTVTGYITHEGGTQAAIDGTCAHLGNGQWKADLTAAEMNADLIGLLFVHDDGVPVNFVIPMYTDATGGAITFPYTVYEEDGTTPVSNVKVWCTTDITGSNVVQNWTTNSLGQATFYLDAGTYYFWRQKNGWNFVNPDKEEVS